MGNLRAWVEDVKRKGVLVGYRVRYRPPHSDKPKQEPGIFERKGDANIVKDRVEERLLDGRLGRTSPKVETRTLVEKWIQECRVGLANRKGTVIREESIKTYISHLEALIVRAPRLIQIDDDLLKLWKQELASVGNSLWTIAGKLRDAKNFLGWCKRRGYIHFDPFADIAIAQPEAMPRYYGDDEIYALECAAQGGVMHLALRLGYKCGLRRSEILRADKRDIRWLEDGTGELTIWSDQSKNHANRTVPLPPSVMELLGTRGSGKLYPGWSKEKFDYHWARLKAKAGIVESSRRFKKQKWAQERILDDEEDQARFHDLRHTFCRLFLERKAGDISDLAKITGHKDVNVLYRVYSHFRTSALHESMAIMEKTQPFNGATVEKLSQI